MSNNEKEGRARKTVGFFFCFGRILPPRPVGSPRLTSPNETPSSLITIAPLIIS